MTYFPQPYFYMVDPHQLPLFMGTTTSFSTECSQGQ